MDVRGDSGGGERERERGRSVLYYREEKLVPSSPRKKRGARHKLNGC